MFKISFYVDLPDVFDFSADELPDVLTMEKVSTMFAVKSDNDYLYCDYRKIPYRRVIGDTKKLIATFGKFVDKLFAAVVEEHRAGNIHPNFIDIVERKIQEV